MNYLLPICLTAYTLIVLAVMVKVLMTKRTPTKTLVWLLVLCFIPVVGVICYFFFGQDTRKERMISERSINQLTKRSMLEFAEQEPLVLPERNRTLMHLFAYQHEALPFKVDDTVVYTDGHRFFLALIAAMGRAKDHIHLLSYIFDDDALGRLIADVLIDKARAGVEVRVVYDDVGCWKTRRALFERMRRGGVDVHAFMPVRFPAFTSKVNYRNHRKLCVIDGQTGFIGGMNIALRYVKGRGNMPWHDLHVQLRGPVVYALQRAFLIDWYFVDRTLITNRKYYPPMPAMPDTGTIAQVVMASPMMPWPEIMQGYVRILMEARSYVFMQTPYFMPTDPVLFALCTAAKAGVDVRLMLPRHADAFFTDWASRSFVSQVVEAGVKVFLYQEGFLHSKMLVCDDRVCTCGSTNIDFRSFENNFEGNVFFYGKDMALKLKNIFIDDQEKSVLLTPDAPYFSHRFFPRLWEGIIRLFSPLL